ncbi:ABC transporter permease [Glycomyces tenuis]|uniref:ABC transporter permease n=1 Tax=Glycomyces tenuis TaxID=58116 RepID=UPI000424B52D|nr:ABC transporter permease [Glycomyces tenuis]
MNGLGDALWAEARKAAASRVLRTAAVLLVAGVAVLGAALTAAVGAGSEQIAAKLGPLADATGWALLLAVVTQIVAAGALLTFGITLSWSFGREFTDGTINGLFAIPTTRPALVTAKLLVHLAWTALVGLALTVLVAGVGLAIGLGGIDAASAAGLVRLFALTALSGLLATPAAWAATLGRGPMAGVATAVGLIVVAQTAALALPRQGAWLPLAAPAFWALDLNAVTPAQLGLVPLTAVAFGALTARAWNRLQLDR